MSISSKGASSFQISHSHIGDFLKNHQMRIPELQRSYEWGKEQARELCGDLEQLIEARRSGRPHAEHFFGTVVVVERLNSPDDIVDGQQRVTTITVLLALLHAALTRLRDECLAVASQNAANRSVSGHHQSLAQRAGGRADELRSMLFVTKLSSSGKQVMSPRVTVSPEITGTYGSFLLDGSGAHALESARPATDLRKVCEVFEHRLVEPEDYGNKSTKDKLDYLEAVVEAICHGLLIIRLSTAEAGRAYGLFESLNARGVPLNVVDHLKVWMLSVFAEAGEDEAQVAAQMRKIASDDVKTQENYFEDFYKARSQDTKIEKGPRYTKTLVQDARRRVFRDPDFPKRDPENKPIPDVMKLTDRISYEVDYMMRLYPIWAKLRQSADTHPFLPSMFQGTKDEIWTRNRLELLLSTLKHQNVYPFLMVAADRLAGSPASFTELVHMIERFFFRYRTICGGSETKITQMYNSLLVALDANPGFDMNLVKQKMRNLIADGATDATFRTAIPAKLGYGGSATIRTKYFLQMLEEYSSNPKPLMQPDPLKLSNWHLEHIVPQTPNVGDPFLQAEEVDSIGNLCLLPPWINTKLSNMSFQEKQARAKELRDKPGKDQVAIKLADASKIFYSGSGPVWSSADVATRIKSLQDFACQVFTI